MRQRRRLAGSAQCEQSPAGSLWRYGKSPAMLLQSVLLGHCEEAVRHSLYSCIALNGRLQSACYFENTLPARRVVIEAPIDRAVPGPPFAGVPLGRDFVLPGRVMRLAEQKITAPVADRDTPGA